MRGIWIVRSGGYDALEVRETPRPTPGPGEILIRVGAAGLGIAEIMARQGIYPPAPKLPAIMGYEVAGVVEAQGIGVNEPAVGARIMAICHFGAQAEFVAVPAEYAVPIPDGLSVEQAACLPWNYIVAYHVTFRAASLRPGDRVLVHMAAGGVGSALVHLLRTIPNVEIFATASSAKLATLQAQGCQHPIDYRHLDYADEVRRITQGQGVDVVLDPLGGRDWRKGYELLRPGGRLVAYGLANMLTPQRRNLGIIIRERLSIPRFSPLDLIFHNRSVAGVSVGRMWSEPRLLVEGLRDVAELQRKHHFEPLIDSIHPFNSVATAHRRIEERANIGKVLLVPDSNA